MTHSNNRSPRSTRLRRLLRWTGWMTLAGAVALGGWTAWRAASGKTSPPFYTRLSAERARKEMRHEKADRWAPNLAREAEAAYNSAVVEYRREEEALIFVRNFDKPRDLLRRAEESLRRAQRVAIRERDEKRATAKQAIDRAHAVVDATQRVAEAIALGKYEQMLLQRSELALREAELIFDHEDYVSAAQRADLAGLQAARLTDRAAQVAARFTDPVQVRNWKRMIDETIDWSRRTGGAAIVVAKEAHTLTLYERGRAVKTWHAELGFNSARDKVYAGDNATPEGRYHVVAKYPASGYYKAFLLNYPNEEDRANFLRLRRTGELPGGTSPGSMIEIHGEGGRGRDWTNGCVALANREMDELYPHAGVGTPVTIVGSDGSAGAYTEIVRMHKLSSATRAE